MDTAVQNAAPLVDDAGAPAPDNGGDVKPVQRGRIHGRRAAGLYHKPTEAELDQRVIAARAMLLQGEHDKEICRQLAIRFDQSTRTIERYLRLARDRLVDEAGRTKEEMRALNLCRYWEIYNSDDARPIDKIKALERVDKLLGLEIHSPRQVELTGKDGGPITSQASVTVLGVDLTSKVSEFAGPLRQAAIANYLERMGGAAAPAHPDIIVDKKDDKS